MRRLLRKLLTVLDGAPPPAAAKPGLRRGQSLVELTLVMPVLIITFMGMIEIGWLANNYLILLDITREGGRFGATADPLEWIVGDEYNLERMDCDTFEEPKTASQLAQLPLITRDLPVSDITHLETHPSPRSFADSAEGPYGYYDGVACTVVRNLEPMPFDPDRDDVVVSVFTYAVGDYDTDGDLEVRVVGRFPAHSNECGDDGVDPFDINRSGDTDLNEDLERFDTTVDNIRGYVLTGHHQVSDVDDCLGSEFSLGEVEGMLNDVTQLELENTPNGALLLVEMFWHHGQLLRFPFFTMIGDNFELHVWSIFPVTAAEATATPLP